MRVKKLLEGGKRFLSLEFFPPKERRAWPGFFDVVRNLQAIDPLFVSVTYGAGGTTQTNTLEIVTRLKQEYRLEPVAHLTCVGASAERLEDFLEGLSRGGVENVLALRGDPPRGETVFRPDPGNSFAYASDLVGYIRERYPDMGIGVAGYPEGHPESSDREADLNFLKHKVDRGADFVTTQLFFDNDLYFDFVARARTIGIDLPIIPGVLPVLSLDGLRRMLGLCGASLPGEYGHDLEHIHKTYGPAAVRGLGLGFAIAQVRDLLQRGAPGVHLYTLNRADTCMEIFQNVRDLL
ncbi:MAG: methylenetetrahydrofolate reductase [NAD(P)H] [Deltaproteobacteria bacterium]|nr:methylenetetrahydrofolate reductase [NAD(P)H] [Deltaproteobacteria bacterium]